MYINTADFEDCSLEMVECALIRAYRYVHHIIQHDRIFGESPRNDHVSTEALYDLLGEINLALNTLKLCLGPSKGYPEDIVEASQANTVGESA